MAKRNISFINSEGQLVKKCSKCGNILLEDKEHFFYRKTRNKFVSICKKCIKLSHKLYRLNSQNPENWGDANKIRQCTKCDQIFTATLDNFTKDKEGKYGLTPTCKACQSNKRKRYWIENPEKCRGYTKKWMKNPDNRAKKLAGYKKYHRDNRESILERHIHYRQDNIELYLERERRYRDKNRAKMNRRQRERSFQRYQIVKNDPKKSLSLTMGNAIRQSLVTNKNGHHWEKIIGYTITDLMMHLEKQFKPGMSWNNHGKWHIDHKVPVSAFNFKTYNDLDFKKCWSLSNLQPLWAVDNMKKGTKIQR